MTVGRSPYDEIAELLKTGRVALTPEDRELVDSLQAKLESSSASTSIADSSEPTGIRELMDLSLNREQIASLFAMATLELAQVDSTAAARGRSLLRAWLQRRAPGAQLYALTYGSELSHTFSEHGQ